MSPPCPTINDATLADLSRVLPKKPLYGAPSESGKQGIGWLLSPRPYELNAFQLDLLQKIGPCLYRFLQAVDVLYKASLKREELDWVKHLFDAGKPQQLLTFAQMGRLKQHLPLVIRPDLLVTEKGFALCEIDAVPGGIGFTEALHQAYKSLGFQPVGSAEGIPREFLKMLLAAAPPNQQEHFIAIIVSDEAGDYRDEMTWLVEEIRQFYPHIALLHPREVTLERNQLGFVNESNQFQSIQIVYRFFELFDLPNIPQIELIQYAIKKGMVFCTPPFKPHLEEKLALALIHYPILEAFWLETMGENNLQLLKSIVPEGWILDPKPLPPHAAVVPSLILDGKHFKDFSQLGQLTQKQRELVIKPSGFSPLAWGSRGVKVGHDLSQNHWEQALETAFSQFETAPWLMQRFENTRLEPYQYFHPQTGKIEDAQGRTRLCPYYFVIGDTSQLVDILATTCPKDKKIIHGMRDGVMRPTYAAV
jgi:hypothetical protein